MNRRILLKAVPVQFVRFTGITFFCLSLALVAAWGADKPSKTIVTPDGKAIRKVYIHAASPDMESSAANQLGQNSCLTVVHDEDQADAVLHVGAALHAVEHGLTTPGVFGPSARSHAPNNSGSVSTPCSDTGGGSGCTTTPPGDMPPTPVGTWPGNAGGNLNISLTLPGNAPQELWTPSVHSRRPWSAQLRIAAGCPVCPGMRFDRQQRHEYKTYRNWMSEKCPGVLPESPEQSK